MLNKLFRLTFWLLLALFAWNYLVSPETRKRFRRITEIAAIVLVLSSVVSLAMYFLGH